jgi:hydrogenase expression/formation protein HypC
MCLGIPGKIIEIVDHENGIAKAEVSGVRRNVSIQLLTDDQNPPKVGDWILIHVGFALCKLDEREAEATLRMLEEMSTAYADELRALEKSEIL